MQRALLIWMFCLAAHAVDAWPGEDKASLPAARLLMNLDPRMRLEMSDCFWNPDTRILWVTAAGAGKQGSWALAYDSAGGGGFSVLEYWPTSVACDEGITQAGLAATAANQHRVFVLLETSGRIVENLRTIVPGAGDGTSVTPHSWDISQLGSDENEGLAFIPDSWLLEQGFVRGDGSAYAGSGGGFGGLFLVAKQDGTIHALDLSATTSDAYDHVGVYNVAGSTGSKSALAFDRSIGRLYVHLDSTQLAVCDLSSTSVSGTRHFTRLALFSEPANAGGSGPEGFACAPFLDAGGARNAQRFAWICHDNESGTPDDAVQWYTAFSPETTSGRVLAKLAGDAQTGSGGAALPVALTVRARDGRGYPLVGGQVTFSAGAGSLSATTVTVDRHGKATTTWTLGASLGSQAVTATMPGLTAVTFTATAVSDGTDTTAPALTITPNAVVSGAQPISFAFVFSEGVTGFTAADIAVTGGTKGALSGSGTTYTLPVSPTADGRVAVSVAAGAAADAAGNPSTAASVSVTSDRTRPSLTITPSAVTVADVPVEMTLTFSEPVIGFATGDIAVSGGSAGALSGSGRSWSLRVDPAGAGTLTITVAAGGCTDPAGNTNTAGSATLSVVAVSGTLDVTAIDLIGTTATGATVQVGGAPATITGTGWQATLTMPGASVRTVAVEAQASGRTPTTATVVVDEAAVPIGGGG